MDSQHEIVPTHRKSSKIVTPNGYYLGWRRQMLDHRDAGHMYSVPQHVADKPLPTHAEVTEYPIWDQGQLGSCTGNGVGFVILFDAIKQGLLKAQDVPSRLFIYWGERWEDGTINEDAGAEIRDGIKFIAKYGACLESGPNSWPYDVAKFKQRPPNPCWQNALKFQALNYKTVAQSNAALRGCIAEGFPIVFGFTCYPELDDDNTAKTGYIPMPKSGEQPVGGHCVCIVGYDDSKRRFKIRNSWSDSWGDKGYGYLDYEYVLRNDLASDFWTVRVVG